MEELMHINEIFPEYNFDLKKNKNFQYQVIKTKGKTPQGRYGVVYKAKNIQSAANKANSVTKAIKFLKPEHALSDKAKVDFLEEIKILSEISHPNIIKIYDWGNLKLSKSDTKINVPYYIMEYVEGKDLEQTISNRNGEGISKEFFEKLVTQMLSALDFCHKQSRPLLHLDIKPDNILIDNSNRDLRFVLTDFGKAKLMKELVLKETDFYDTAGGGIFKYVHPDIRPFLRKNSVPYEVFLRLKDKCDLYSIGKVFKDVLEHVTDFKGLNKTLIPWTYFINDLCYDKNEKSEFYDTTLLEINKTNKALILAEKLLEKEETSNDLFRIKYLEKGVSLLRLPDKETIPFPKIASLIIDTPEFQKLRNISQLAVTDLVYPGATHTRFSHALGAYYRCLSYIRGLSRNPLFRYIYSAKDIESVILASLLHDIGHYPFAHYLEEINGLMDLNIHHEFLSKRILSGELTKEDAINSEYTAKFFGNFRFRMLQKSVTNQNSIASVLSKLDYGSKVKKILFSKALRGGLLEPLKKIISGPIDCDKLDYLIRDSKYAGVPYAETVDLDRFYYSLTLDTENLHELDLAVSAKGKSAVESIISSRYNLFTEVYWHKTCRAITTMVKNAFWHAHRFIKQSEFEWASMMLNDNEFLWWLAEKIPNESISFDLLGGIKISDSRYIYKRIRTYSYGWKEKEKQKLYNDFINKINDDFARLQAYQIRLAREINKIGEQQSDEWQTLENHHVLVDIPNMRFDNYSMLKLKYPPSVEGKIFYSLSDISPLADSIYSSLSNTTKKVRIFVHPKFYPQISLLKGSLDEAIHLAFA